MNTAKYVDLENCTPAQRTAMKEISHLYNLMLQAWDEGYLFDLYCQADDLWQENFPFQASQWGDDWWVTRRYNDMVRYIRDRPMKSFTVNLFGCTVNINTTTDK